MSETYFFMTLTDTERFVRFLITEFDARFAVDGGPTPVPQVCTGWEDLAHLIEQETHRLRVFVQSPRWDRYPLCVSEVHAKDGRHYFSIDQRYGGPAFDFLLSGPSTKAVRDLVPGWFSDYPWYIVDKSWLSDHSKYQTFDRPMEIAVAHKAVRSYLRRNGHRSGRADSRAVGPWILADALLEWRNGMWLRQGEWRFDPRQGT